MYQRKDINRSADIKISFSARNYSKKNLKGEKRKFKFSNCLHEPLRYLLEL